MRFQFTNPWFLLLLAPALAWLLWFGLKTDVQTSRWRQWMGLGLRVVIVVSLVLAMAGVQWLLPVEGMNVFFVLDRSDSIPSQQQDAARQFVNQTVKQKKNADKAGVIVFGADASIETSPQA